jgi:hypothetical protein
MKKSIALVDHQYSKKMSIEHYVQSRLKRWAIWFSSKDNPKLNYQSKSLIYRMMHEAYVSLKDNSLTPSPSNLLAEEVENIIHEMFHESLTFQKCAIALREEYLSRKKYQSDRAIAVGMSVTQFKMHVDKARVYIAGVLKERYKFQ